MNIIKAYTSGFKNSLRRPKMIFLIYTITLLLGLSLALPFFFSFLSASGNSMISKTLDWTTFQELVNFHSWNLESIFQQGIFTVFVYWLLMVFFVGGIIRCFNKEDYSVSTFFSGAGVNFLRFLVCDILMILSQIIMFIVLFGFAHLIKKLFGGYISSEQPLYWSYCVAAFLYGCAVVLLLMICDYAKFYMEISETHRVFKAIGKAVKYVFNNFVKTYFLYALLLVLPILTLVLYKLTFDKIGTAATWGLIAMFFIQQFFIILRIWYRIWSLSSQFEMYADDYVKVSTFDIVISKKYSEEKTPEYDNLIVSVENENTTTEDDILNPQPVEEVAESNNEDQEEQNVTIETTTTTTTTATEQLEEQPKEEVSYDNLIVAKEDETPEKSEEEVEAQNEVVEEKTIVLNDEGDTFTYTTTTTSEPEIKTEESKENTTVETKIVETKVVETKTEIEPEVETETESKTENVAEVSDEVDPELLEQFYANDGEDFSQQATQEEESSVVDSDSDFTIDTAMGANISLEEEEEDIVTTVAEENDPKIVKLSDVILENSEVVPENVLDGEPSYERHQDEQFTKYQLKDGEPVEDSNPAMG